ncbi:hypothetical protein ACP275_04G103700 [Erythranthe tilingii]
MMGLKMRLVVSMVMVLMICIADATPARETHQDSDDGFIQCVKECLKHCKDFLFGQCPQACRDICRNMPPGAFAPASQGGRI